MAIRLISAMLVTETRTTPDEAFVMIEPQFGIRLPTEQRAQFEAAKVDHGLIELPPYKIVLLLWGGTPGTRYRITGGFGIPGEQPGKAMSSEIVWKEEPAVRLTPKLEGKIQFDNSAIYELRLAANDEPLGVLPVVVRWNDETNI